MPKSDRPAKCTEDHLIYLDELREEGITNMFGASSFLQKDFDELSGSEARQILSYWMKTFGEMDR